MIKIAVCDDNRAALDYLSVIIKESFLDFTDDISVEIFSNGNLFLKSYAQEPFDVIFLDIDMPHIGGFEVASQLRDIFSKCFIVFVTSHSDLVYKSFDFQPFHFIRKDDNYSLKTSISGVVERLMVHIKQNDSVIMEDKQNKKQAVFIRDIIYMESSGHYINYFIEDKETPFRIRGSMLECEKYYSEYNFARIHKRFLVNMRYILKIDNKMEQLILSKNKKLPVSRNYKPSFDENYTMYLRRTI